MKKKISNFLKTPVFSITLTFINDYVLNRVTKVVADHGFEFSG